MPKMTFFVDTLCINCAQNRFIYFINSQQRLMHDKYQLKLNRITLKLTKGLFYADCGKLFY